jgi:hypothetical protein
LSGNATFYAGAHDQIATFPIQCERCASLQTERRRLENQQNISTFNVIALGMFDAPTSSLGGSARVFVLTNVSIRDTSEHRADAIGLDRHLDG